MPVTDEDFKALKDAVAALAAKADTPPSGISLPSLSNENLNRLVKLLFAALVTAGLAWIKSDQSANSTKIDQTKQAAEEAKGEAAAAKTMAHDKHNELKATLATLEKKQDETKTAIEKKP